MTFGNNLKKLKDKKQRGNLKSGRIYWLTPRCWFWAVSFVIQVLSTEGIGVSINCSSSDFHNFIFLPINYYNFQESWLLCGIIRSGLSQREWIDKLYNISKKLVWLIIKYYDEGRRDCYFSLLSDLVDLDFGNWKLILFCFRIVLSGNWLLYWIVLRELLIGKIIIGSLILIGIKIEIKRISIEIIEFLSISISFQFRLVSRLRKEDCRRLEEE